MNVLFDRSGGRRVRRDPHGDCTEQNRSCRPGRRRCVISSFLFLSFDVVVGCWTNTRAPPLAKQRWSGDAGSRTALPTLPHIGQGGFERQSSFSIFGGKISQSAGRFGRLLRRATSLHYHRWGTATHFQTRANRFSTWAFINVTFFFLSFLSPFFSIATTIDAFVPHSGNGLNGHPDTKIQRFQRWASRLPRIVDRDTIRLQPSNRKKIIITKNKLRNACSF